MKEKEKRDRDRAIERERESDTQGEFRMRNNGAIEDQIPQIGKRSLNKDKKKTPVPAEEEKKEEEKKESRAQRLNPFFRDDPVESSEEEVPDRSELHSLHRELFRIHGPRVVPQQREEAKRIGDRLEDQ